MDKTKLNSLDGLEILNEAENYLFSLTYEDKLLGIDPDFHQAVRLLRERQAAVIKTICGIVGQHYQEVTGNRLAAEQIMNIASRS